jgi:hypothetical protein
MAFVNDPAHPANMTPKERVAEVAAILTEGVRRLRRRAAVPAVPGEVPAVKMSLESGPNGLDDGAETRLYGHRG